jgi:uncharacterized protein
MSRPHEVFAGLENQKVKQQTFKQLLRVLIVFGLLGAFLSCSRVSPVSQQSSLPAASPTPQCSLPFSGNYVNDFAQVMTTDARDKLEQKLDDLKSRANIDFAVVTLETTNEQSIFDYSLALARCWNLGTKNPDGSGLLLMLAVKDRKWHMQISRSIEKVLSNEEIQDAGRLMTARLRVGQYSEGVHECVDATIKTLAGRRGFTAVP